MARYTLFSGESKNIEYKIILLEKSEKYMKTIGAFVNAQDGIVNAVSNPCVPQIIPDIEPQTIEGKTVIIVYGLPEPKFQEFANMFRVELFRDSLPMTSENRNIGEVLEKHRIVELNSTQQEIVKFLLENNELLTEKIALLKAILRNQENWVFLSDIVLLKMDIGKLQIVGKRTMKIPNDYMEISGGYHLSIAWNAGKYIVMYRNIG